MASLRDENHEMTERHKKEEEASDKDLGNEMDVQHDGKDPKEEETKALLTAGSHKGESGHDAADSTRGSQPLNLSPNQPNDGTQPPDSPTDNVTSMLSDANPPICTNSCTLLKRRTIINCTIVLLLIITVIILLNVLVKCLQPGCKVIPQSDPPCLDDWIWFRRRCYYFSKKDEEKNWTSSESFCSHYNASLVVTESEDVKDFITRFKCSDNYWFGLKKEGQSWKWQNGKPATLEVLGAGGDCAFLTSAINFEASSARCSSPRRWICSKPDAFQIPKGP